jgi:hypothetical protein
MGKSKFITKQNVQDYEMLNPILDSLYDEVKELSKKKQDGVLNKFKVAMINKVLSQIKELLKNESTTQFLELLDEDQLPTNSDAVLVMTQFNSSLEQFKNRYCIYDDLSSEWEWQIKG